MQRIREMYMYDGGAYNILLMNSTGTKNRTKTYFPCLPSFPAGKFLFQKLP